MTNHMLKGMRLLATMALCLFLTAWASPTENMGTLPSYMLKTLDGKEIDLADYGKDGRPTIVSFWATWCKPCLNELNAIAEYYPEWQETYNVELVAISLDNQRTAAKVPSVVKTLDWEYDILLDVNGESYRKFNFATPPYLVLVDSAGNIVYKHSGYLPGSELEVEEKLKEISGK
ncbi:MAG: TlpA family protein disulfide reductase [Bacteroidetes bacterium]|nr:TlpA family protein disulfide reductase [Bacteroidota bacterium]